MSANRHESVEVEATLPLLTAGQSGARRAAIANKAKAKCDFKGPYQRSVHPSTGEVEYTENQRIFMQGVADFKLKTGRNFPTLCEVLWVAEQLGWSREHGWPSAESSDRDAA